MPDVTHAAGTNQPSAVDGLRNAIGSRVREYRNNTAASATATEASSSLLIVGLPGRKSTEAPPARATPAATKQNQRVRMISSASSASSGEPTVVALLLPVPVGDFVGDGVRSRRMFGAIEVSIEWSSRLEDDTCV